MMRLRVQEVAKQKGFTMGKLRREAHIAHNTLRTMYKDPFRRVSTQTLDKIAVALGVDVSELIESIPDINHPHPTIEPPL